MMQILALSEYRGSILTTKVYTWLKSMTIIHYWHDQNLWIKVPTLFGILWSTCQAPVESNCQSWMTTIENHGFILGQNLNRYHDLFVRRREYEILVIAIIGLTIVIESKILQVRFLFMYHVQNIPPSCI